MSAASASPALISSSNAAPECPIDHKNLSPEALQQYQQQFLSSHRGHIKVAEVPLIQRPHTAHASLTTASPCDSSAFADVSAICCAHPLPRWAPRLSLSRAPVASS